MKQREFRNITDVVASESNVITGEIKYNVPSLDIGFREMIAPTAFSKTLSDGYDVRAYYNHDSSKVLGRVKNGSLVLENSSTSLKFAITVPDTQEGRDIYSLVKEGYVTGVSFGFQCMADHWEKINGQEFRIVTEAKLFEITICSEPAYEQNTCQARSLSEAFKDKELSDDDKAQIQAEIEALQSMIPTTEPEKEPEGPSEEELQKQAEEAQRAAEEQQKMEELNAQIESLTKDIEDYTHKLEELEKE